MSKDKSEGKKIDFEKIIEDNAEYKGEPVAFMTAAPGESHASVGLVADYWPVIQRLLKEYGLKYVLESIPTLRAKIDEDWQPKQAVFKFIKARLLSAIDILYSQLRGGDVEFTELAGVEE